MILGLFLNQIDIPVIPQALMIIAVVVLIAGIAFIHGQIRAKMHEAIDRRLLINSTKWTICPRLAQSFQGSL